MAVAVAVTVAAMVTSGSSMRWHSVAGDLAGVKGRYATGSKPETLDTAQVTGLGEGMNDPEVTMQRPPRTTHHGLQAHDLALTAAGIVLQLGVAVPAPVKPIADQAMRAAVSVALNLAEGQGRAGRDRYHHWRIAYASALEAGSALTLLSAARCVDLAQTEQALELLDRVRAITWRLLHPAR